MRIVQRAWLTRLAAIMMRLDVRNAASQEYAIDLAKNLLEIQVFCHDGNNERQGVCAVDQGREVFLSNGVKGLPIDGLAARRHADYGFEMHMGTNPDTPLWKTRDQHTRGAMPVKGS